MPSRTASGSPCEERARRRRGQGEDLEQRENDEDQRDDRHRGHDGAVAPVLAELLAVEGPDTGRAGAHWVPASVLASTSSLISSR